MNYLKWSAVLCLVMTFAHAETKYAASTLTTLSLTETTKKTGKILPTTPFEILNQEGDKLTVKITGWNINGENRILYFAEGVKIMSAVFAPDANNKVEKLKSKNIDGETWEEVSITTIITESNYENSADVLMKKANNLFQTNCSLCHPAPDINHFNPGQWPSVAKEMGSRTPLSKEDIALLTQYLQKTTTSK